MLFNRVHNIVSLDACLFFRPNHVRALCLDVVPNTTLELHANLKGVEDAPRRPTVIFLTKHHQRSYGRPRCSVLAWSPTLIDTGTIGSVRSRDSTILTGNTECGTDGDSIKLSDSITRCFLQSCQHVHPDGFFRFISSFAYDLGAA